MPQGQRELRFVVTSMPTRWCVRCAIVVWLCRDAKAHAPKPFYSTRGKAPPASMTVAEALVTLDKGVLRVPRGRAVRGGSAG